jgi:hypothetical protein
MDGAISIGRNVGDQPMPKQQWRRFVTDVSHAISESGGVGYATAYGNGAWDGIPERNAVLTFEHADVSLEEKLRTLAKRYRQDAISLIAGENRLVKAGE